MSRAWHTSFVDSIFRLRAMSISRLYDHRLMAVREDM